MEKEGLLVNEKSFLTSDELKYSLSDGLVLVLVVVVGSVFKREL